MPDKLQKLESVLKIMTESITREEFVQAFKQVVDAVVSMDRKLSAQVDANLECNNKDIEDLVKKTQRYLDEVQSASETTFANVRRRSLEAVDALFNRMRLQEKFDEMALRSQEQMDKVDAVVASIPSVDELVQQTVSRIPEDPEETAQEVRDKLETLQGDERLDKKAVRGIEGIEEQIKKLEIRPTTVVGGGAKGIGLYVDGSKKLLTAQTINLVPGTNITMTYSYANGRNDITISAGAGAFSLLTATGAIDNSNVDFTFASRPSVVVVNGASYRENNGWTWTAGTLTATLTNPVGVGGDIYGIG